MFQGNVDDCYKKILDNIKRHDWPTPFVPEPQPWFPESDERCIEVPWALSRYSGQKSVLEIGLALADLMLIRAQLQLKEYTNCDLSGMDLVDIHRTIDRFKSLNLDLTEIYNFHQEDARDTNFENNSFDLIFCISTLEHIGFDEFEEDERIDSIFKRPENYPEALPSYKECRDDRKAITEIKRILSPHGSLLLTVPFGNRGICLAQDSKGLWGLGKEYNWQEWNSLLKESGLNILEERFFVNKDTDGWIELHNPESFVFESRKITDVVKCVGCVELQKS